jgi:predicted TIM-barrel fold metal-dependent hydrolase
VSDWDDLYVVDCDAHFTEPEDLWSSRVPASMQDLMPQQVEIDGRTGWFLNGEMWASTGGNTIRRDRQKVLGSHVVQPFSEIDPAAWSVPERLSLLDALAIDTQIIYPNGIGFASNHVFAIKDPEQRAMVLRVYNDFLADIQVESHERLLPQALLPIWDMDFTIQEMTRLLDRGIRGFTLSDKPELLGLPELIQPYFAPMWDLFNQSGAVPNFHIGAGARAEEMNAMRAASFVEDSHRGSERIDPPAVADPYWRTYSRQRRLAVQATQISMSNIRIIANLCASNLFDRYPNLKVVSAESGIGWIPFLLESLEFQLAEMVTDLDPSERQERTPTEYFRDHIYAMFWFETFAPEHMIDQIGVHNVLIETDIPHPTCLYPTTREHLEKVLSNLTPYARRRVLQDNAVELYRVNVPIDRQLPAVQ